VGVADDLTGLLRSYKGWWEMISVIGVEHYVHAVRSWGNVVVKEFLRIPDEKSRDRDWNLAGALETQFCKEI